MSEERNEIKRGILAVLEIAWADSLPSIGELYASLSPRPDKFVFAECLADLVDQGAMGSTIGELFLVLWYYRRNPFAAGEPHPHPDLPLEGEGDRREAVYHSRQAVLDRATEVVCRDRSATHGEPEQSFAVIADLWSVYLGKQLMPHDVAALMALLKVARIRTSPEHADNWVDLAGYAACGAEVAGVNVVDDGIKD